ncbi:MAG TPA: hypothetical protein VGZ47_15400 [Gemmataceae bacterium]|nr:hypothetical protein [Gemmataceae bacterium]
MHRLHLLLVGCVFLTLTLTGRAEEKSPLRLIPQEANLVIRIEKPRQLAEGVLHLEVVQQARQLPFVREQLESPLFQRFLQLVAYYEKDLGQPWPELLDKLAAGGITLAIKVPEDNGPALLVIQGSDKELAQRFVKLVLSVIEQEQIRTEAKERTQIFRYRDVEVHKNGGEFFLAQVGSTLLLSNREVAMKLALDLNAEGDAKSLAHAKGPKEARAVLPQDCLAWLWLDLDYIHKLPNAKAVFSLPANDPIPMLAAGGTINAVGRAPFLAVGLYRHENSFGLTFRLPGERKDVPEALALHVPKAGEPGTLPLLEPKSVLFSESLYFDPKAFWEERSKLFNDTIAKQIEEAEKGTARFLPGTSLGKLLSEIGPHHRIVAAYQENKGYNIKPNQNLPAFAVVNSMRDKQFAKSAEGILRGAALLAGTQAKLKLYDETYEGVKINGWRFPEDGTFPNDPENLRFNFTPCFASAGDQFVVCSNVELCRELIGLLKKEQEAKPAAAAAVLRMRFYARGGADVLKSFQDQLLAQLVLDQAIKAADAKKQADQLIDWARQLGSVEIRSEYTDKDLRFHVEWKMK